MDTSSSSEKLKSRPSSEAVKSDGLKEKPAAAAETKRRAAEVVQTEGVDSQEGAESSEGNISESASEDKSTAPVGGGKVKYSDDQIEAIRAKLLAALPPQEVMIKQIRQKLYKQEKDLTKRLDKLKGKAAKHAFEVNIVVMQLRKIREFFSVLAHATYEIVKHLWLKIVHGV